ncbi:MAG: Smr/MutS family protein [Bacteriovorax sp.]|nr:Smr/MutS family protein [Bacteriovorax sp.]
MSLNLLNGNSEALELLDWYQLTRDLTSLAHFESTKNRLTSSPLFHDVDYIQRDLDRLEFFISHYDDFSMLFSAKFRMLPEGAEFFSLIPDLFKGKFFEAKELNFFALLLEAYHQGFSPFRNLVFEKNYEIKADGFQKLRKNFLIPLREFIDFSGNASYERHPLLKKLYSEVLALESDLRTSIQKASKSDLYANKLQLDNYDIINDRYVLAVRSDSYNSDLGPIISRSQSGMTLFVEPYEIRDKSNKRIHLLSEIEATMLKLTIELSKIAHAFADDIASLSEWVVELDWINTKATYSQKLGLTKPKLTPQFYFELNGLFHPLLNHPIKNNLLLDGGHKGLIISGPNTGGKTVVLKSLCLSVLFVHMGLFVPASSAVLYPVKNLFYFSHDHQNLAEGLSSFASESKYYLELLQNLEEKNLIVIDEIFNSTSSEEASALAIAFLEEVHERSASKVIISTHHQVLKTFMHARADYVSAHVGYDFDLNRPTYKLILGEPGSSLAFKIFDNLSSLFGLKTQISEKAKTLLDQKQVTYESLLQELSQKKIDLDKLLTTNRNLQIELKNQKSSMEGLLFLEREKVLNEYTKKIRGLFDQAEILLGEVKNGDITTRRKLGHQMAFIQSALNKEAPQKILRHDVDEKYTHYRPIAFEDIQINMLVFSIGVKKDVKVTQVNSRKKEIQIQHGALSVWVTCSDLRWASGVKTPSRSIAINVDRTTRGDIEIDCRGMRLDEFQKNCHQAIEEVFTGIVPFVTIIHGHGDGILKGWLRNYLKRECQDLHFENIEGNDGCTKISLKN